MSVKKAWQLLLPPPLLSAKPFNKQKMKLICTKTHIWAHTCTYNLISSLIKHFTCSSAIFAYYTEMRARTRTRTISGISWAQFKRLMKFRGFLIWNVTMIVCSTQISSFIRWRLTCWTAKKEEVSSNQQNKSKFSHNCSLPTLQGIQLTVSVTLRGDIHPFQE